MKRKKIVRFLKRLNPKELATEVHVYGYDFSWRIHIQILLVSLLTIGAIGILFHLEMRYLFLVMALLVMLLPLFILNTYKRMYEQKRFADVAIYVEQMLYSFQKREKIVSALKETGEVFEDGEMKWAIEDAVEYLEMGVANSEQGTLREALAMIEKSYPCVKLHIAHELFISSEEYGGNVENSILLLLDDIEHWKRRGYQLQAEKKRCHGDNIISIVVATMMCAIALYVINALGKLFPGAKDVNLFKMEIIQISSLLFIVFMLYVLAKSMKSLTTNWLQNGTYHNKDYLLECYKTVINNDKKVGKRHLFTGCGCLLTIVAAVYTQKSWMTVLSIFLLVFMLAKQRVYYNIARKDVSEEIYLTLPQWLMELALLLQNNNVQVSIAKSIPDTSAILQIELEGLMERLKKEPDKLKSYTDFCKQFDVPEAQSVMKMLHAISESGSGNTSVQINNLIYCVQKMQNTADEISNKNIAFRMKMIFSYPVMAATLKLLVDLTVGMVYMFQLLGSIGGM